MDNLLKVDLREIVAAFSLMISLIFALTSVFIKNRKQCLRFTSVILIIGISLFANNPCVYILSMFMIASTYQKNFIEKTFLIIRISVMSVKRYLLRLKIV